MGDIALLATLRLSGSLQKSAEVMKSMQDLVKVSDVAASMRELSKEMMKVLMYSLLFFTITYDDDGGGGDFMIMIMLIVMLMVMMIMHFLSTISNTLCTINVPSVDGTPNSNRKRPGNFKVSASGKQQGRLWMKCQLEEMSYKSRFDSAQFIHS